VLDRGKADLLDAWAGARATALVATVARPRGDDARRAAERPRARARPIRGRTSFRLGGPDAADDLGDTAVFVGNAGLVLAGAFLPHLFRALDMLEQDEKGVSRMRDRAAASRAVHLLQYLVDGRTDAPEPTLVLNKVLAGVPTEAPGGLQIEITEMERQICERLLKSIIGNWSAISNTSIAGLQETFLRREGKLMRRDDRFQI